MCLMCLLKAQQGQAQSVDQAAQEAAEAIVGRLFGEDAVKAAKESTDEPELSKEEMDVMDDVARSIADQIFGAQQAIKEDEEVSRADLAEILADQFFGAIFGAEALAEVKADPSVQAQLAKRRKEEQAEKDNVIPFPRMGSTMPESAHEFLKRAAAHMEDRATTYDNPEGERSMEKTVAIFNALRERDLTETEGWLFMSILKLVRANQGEFKSDNYEDLVAYAALMGESEVKAQA
ncbi:DUF6378 domain-containing protein [Acinetobacter baumannii]|nr:hypothetical protein [Acinetobacter baumannii]EKU8237845.1 hypothetical protein [Acinetobacter baumannii]EKU8309770.1 hypothetical protein [Acinetobacter baumannii]EKU8413554.1 hypothetical protein [Acinetobacter baumannii]EKU9263344.1 hypothetical protein [Acinetobacter baumannii]